MIEILLALSKNNKERSTVDPRRQLGRAYREIKNLQEGIKAAQAHLEQLAAANAAEKEELGQLLLKAPQWDKKIMEAKDRLLNQGGLSLKDQLEIQQEVAKADQNRQLGKARISELESKLGAYAAERETTAARLKELKLQYNQRVAAYKQEKSKADLKMAEYNSNEEALLESLSPEMHATYYKALKSNPDSPVALIERGICSGCRIGVPKQLAKLVNQVGQLVCCESCQRILAPAHLK